MSRSYESGSTDSGLGVATTVESELKYVLLFLFLKTAILFSEIGKSTLCSLILLDS